MGQQRRGKGDWAFGLPRATYERTPADEARPAPQYRPPETAHDSGLLRLPPTHPRRNEQRALGLPRTQWRHGDCRWDQVPAA